MKRLITNALVLCLLTSCGKKFLDVRREMWQVVPTKIEHYQSILDNANSMLSVRSSHLLGIVGSDEFRVTREVWENLTTPYQRNAYIWAEEVYEGDDVDDWDNAYQRIFYANLVLDGIAGIDPTPQQHEWNIVKGAALFLRAFNFYQLAQEFCQPYYADKAQNQLGLPLKLESDITMSVKRSSLKDTYARIISDLEVAVQLLPEISANKYRPSKAAAYAVLAKTYLLMANYDEALRYAALCLKIMPELMDYNNLDLGKRYTFPAEAADNNEIIFFCLTTSVTIIGNNRFDADPELLSMYHESDLRRLAFWHSNDDGRVLFKGAYTGNQVPFTGLATDEVWLLKAECLARLGKIAEAHETLDFFKRHRYMYTDGDSHPNPADDMLTDILAERRRQLVLRGIRWEDLRRLNKESRYEKTLVRQVGDARYELQPNHLKYTWQLPDKALLRGGYQPNDR